MHSLQLPESKNLAASRAVAFLVLLSRAAGTWIVAADFGVRRERQRAKGKEP